MPTERPRRQRRPPREWPDKITEDGERILVRERLDTVHESIEDVRDHQEEQEEKIDKILTLTELHVRRGGSLAKLTELALGKDGGNLKWVALTVVALAVLSAALWGASSSVVLGDFSLTTRRCTEASELDDADADMLAPLVVPEPPTPTSSLEGSVPSL